MRSTSAIIATGKAMATLGRFPTTPHDTAGSPRPADARDHRRFALAAVLVSFAIFSFGFAGHYSVRDNMHRLAWTKALLDTGSHEISAYVPDAKFSIYGIGQTLLHVPLVLASRLLERITGSSVEMVINMTLYLINGVVGVLLFYLILRRYGREPRASLAGSLLLGVATIWFPYTKVEHGEPIVVTLILAVWLLASRHPLLGGLIGGFAIAIRLDSLLWLGVTIFFAEASRRQKALAAAGTVPGILLTIWSNWVRTGSPVSSGYQPDFVNPLSVGVYGLLFSAGKSIFLFAPILVLYIAAARDLWRAESTRNLVRWSAALLVIQILFYARWWAWGGEDAWGPRFLILSMMVGQIVVVTSRVAMTKTFAALAAVSFAIHLMAVIIGPHTSLVTGYLRQPMIEDIMLTREHSSPVTYDDIRFNPKYSQVTQTWQLLCLRLFGVRIEYADNTHVGTPYTLIGSSWIESFDPPLRRDEVPIDLLWYVLLKNSE